MAETSQMCVHPRTLLFGTVLQRCTRVTFIYTLTLAFAALCTAPTLAQDARPVYAVLYPDVPQPTRQVFDQVRSGISRVVQSNGGVVRERPLRQGADERAAVRDWVEGLSPTVVLAIGRTALDAVAGLEKRYRVVVGMADIPVTGRTDISGVTLQPDPKSLLSTLMRLSTRTQRVFVVYRPARHGWLIERASKQAKELGVVLIPLPAEDIRAASVHFSNLFRYSNPATDGLWIIDGEFATEDATLPLIVEESWLRRMPVCSTALQHLTRGTLCATFSEPESIGARMVELAIERVNGRPAEIVVPTNAKRGLNVRVATHLGVTVSVSERRDYDVVVGE